MPGTVASNDQADIKPKSSRWRVGLFNPRIFDPRIQDPLNRNDRTKSGLSRDISVGKTAQKISVNLRDPHSSSVLKSLSKNEPDPALNATASRPTQATTPPAAASTLRTAK
jgi:hypothetical protein